MRGLQLQVIAFDANDFKDPMIACAKDANANISVDRFGKRGYSRGVAEDN